MPNSMTCQAILGNLVACQMALAKFEIIDIYIWWDLTFEPAKQLLENVESTTGRPSHDKTFQVIAQLLWYIVN
jgi:hypothetical protein